MYVRRTVNLDTEDIKKLISNDFNQLKSQYGDFHINSFIENSFLSLTCLDEKEIVGFAVFEPFSYHSTTSLSKPHLIYNIQNSFWINFLYIKNNDEEYFQELLLTVYTTFCKVDYILYDYHSNSIPFIMANPKNDMIKIKNDEKMHMIMIDRQGVCPKLNIRMARVEDFDDIKPLLKLENMTPFKVEGERFLKTNDEKSGKKEVVFLSELLHDIDEDRKVLVACNEENRITSVMYTTRNVKIDVEKLKRNYEIDEYDDIIVKGRGGGLNGFEIRMFHAKQEYKSRSIDFLDVAFGLFPEKKYCLVFLPYDKTDHSLLNVFVGMKTVKRVAKKRSDVESVGNFEEEEDNEEEFVKEALFICSRDSFYDQFKVENVTDIKDIQEIAKTLSSPLLYEDGKKKNHKTIVIKNQKNEIVSLSVVEEKYNEKIFNLYNIDEFLNCNLIDFKTDSSFIKQFYVKPIYSNHSSLFLNETLLRLSKKILFYQPSSNENQANPILNKEMREVRKSRQVEKTEEVQIKSNEVMGWEKDKTVPLQYPFFFISKKLSSCPKTVIHSRIVVVGASKSSLSFIETLVTIPYLYFNEIYLISPDGIGEHLSDSFFSFEATQLQNENLFTAINVPNVKIIKDKLIGINKEKKRAYCASDKIVPFDYLILATSREYKLNITDKGSVFPEEGIFNLTVEDRGILELKKYVDEIVLDEDFSSVIVYGSTLDAFCTAQSLITKFKVNSSRIIIVSPNGFDDVFKDENIILKITTDMEKLGIKNYPFFELESLVGDEFGRMSKAKIITQKRKNVKNFKKEVCEVLCSLFINCNNKDVDINMLRTFKNQSLVFDGRLIVDPEFRTTDLSIYAGGPLAKFSRRFGQSLAMEESNSHEIGQNMAYCVLKSIGIREFYDAHIAPDLSKVQRIPTFRKRVFERGYVIGDNHFLRVKIREYDPKESKKLITDNNQRYTSISVNNKTGIINEFTYFGKEVIEENNFVSLVGISAAYCNSLIQRYEENLISDLILFFRENWALALYTDKFRTFRKNINTILLNDYDDIVEFASKISKRLKFNKMKSYAEIQKFIPSNVSNHTKLFIENELIKFLDLNQNKLKSIQNVYFIPKNID